MEESNEKRKYDLNDRLIKFAALIIKIADTTPNTKAGNHLSGQLLRSGTAPALHYGEAQAGESRNDFIHKMSVALKELKESRNCLMILLEAKLYETKEILEEGLKECGELIKIFASSIITAEKNLLAEKQKR